MREGFALQLIPASYVQAWGVNHGWQIGYRFGGKWYVNGYSVDDAEKLMAEIQQATRSQNLSGFTLFEHPGKGWQMSVRRQNEAGWDVKMIPAEQAAVILALLENSGHPDGPWQVRGFRSDDDAILAANRAARERLTRALLAWTPE